MIEVVNKRTHKPTPNDFYIGRGSALGNPFTCKQLANTKAKFQAGSREEAIALYRNWLTDQIDSGNEAVCDAMNKLYRFTKQSKVNLVCYCKPLACHGDVIKEIIGQVINERFTVIDCDNDIRHNWKRFMHEARESKKPVLILHEGEHKIYDDPEKAESRIHLEYRREFSRSTQVYTNYGDPEVTGLPF